ncbi:PTS sugar transporter subunit IIA [Pluralibacter gergoviae]|uniref:PTS sugar transporter subunit IIA n=1 Tax=Pluralibacter gergoviae TaxID=61647 RepID=A0AAI9DHR4_PLUGE|nr:PTS sugar transporter subunit IIA [Pluralibacter gergoviae]AVR05268.1 PTS ascorbate transporter subunit IIA [Pluralibacter gergoviae]EKT9639421.1 PTS sugar transporter subunit IIA [Pluralibacter gergoviae]EKV0913667.1 PTS sugar transporter subunit IIA [Pluralibacter gergoviae]EKV0929956.1 PTS sugar transporter subunit IIA [Pluralibacter gergoviae]EKV3543473.1 PTS sugar transporter subunit IIA [Pluralibacter gergoviae]
MLETWLHDDTIRVQESAQSWQQALAICAAPLLESNTIRPEYLTAIVNEHNRLGPYYVLAPGLAMPHARPEEGALGLGLSLLKLHRGVRFGSEENDPVDLVVMLAAPDRHSHIELISALAALFSSDEDMRLLHQARTVEEIKNIINRF